MPDKTTQLLKDKIKYLFRNGGANSPHTSLHIQYGNSEYANRITEEVINELFTEALSQQQQEDYQEVVEVIMSVDKGDRIVIRDDILKAIAQKRGKV